MAYVPQQAWIQNTTLRNNILLDQTLNYLAYSTVIDACALKADFITFPASDNTEIGEKV